MTRDHHTLCQSLAGVHFSDCRHVLQKLDWHQFYPEVDEDGLLTGQVISAEDDEYDICDVSYEGVIVHDHASDAMIRTS